MAKDLKIRLESLREAETTRLQRLLALKRMGASLEYDDGRKLDDLLEEAKIAIRNLDLASMNWARLHSRIELRKAIDRCRVHERAPKAGVHDYDPLTRPKQISRRRCRS